MLLGVRCPIPVLAAEIVALKVCNSFVSELRMPANGSKYWAVLPEGACGSLDEAAWFVVGEA
jgi:hypothetical protein